MQRHVILEGPDGGGKSTLAEGLSRLTSCKVIHTGGPPVSKDAFLHKFEIMSNAPEGTVFDRCPHISEPIYAQMDGRRVFVPPSELLQKLIQLNAIIVYCRIRSEEQMFKLMYRGNKKLHKSPTYIMEVAKNYKHIVSLYEQSIKQLKADRRLNVINYDYEQQSPALLLAQIQRV